MKRVAQAGLEYLMTYGWALILVATVVGSLVLMFGTVAEDGFKVSDPNSFLLKGSAILGDKMTVKLQNVTGGAIELKSLSSYGYSGCTVNGMAPAGVTIGPGGEITIECTITATGSRTVSVEYEDQLGLTDTVEITGAGGGSPLGPSGESICDDGFDNDGDSLTDCEDPNCHGSQGTGGTCEYATEITCDDLFDNDADTQVDCLDSDCDGDPACSVSLCGNDQLDVGEFCDGDLGLTDPAHMECDDACERIRITGCGVTLSQSGEYFLSTDLPQNSGNCITLAAAEVNLDCESHAITGDGTGSGIFIGMPASHCSVSNCVISNYYRGLRISSGFNSITNNNSSNNVYGGIEIYGMLSVGTGFYNNMACDNGNYDFMCREGMGGSGNVWGDIDDILLGACGVSSTACP